VRNVKYVESGERMTRMSIPGNSVQSCIVHCILSFVQSVPSFDACLLFGSKLYFLSILYSPLFFSLLVIIWLSGTRSSGMHGRE
jgi:hypothetical protein